MSDIKKRETDQSKRRIESNRHHEADNKLHESLSKTDKAIMDWKDPHQKAMTRRDNEAMRVFKESGKSRREFSQAWGQEDHKRWMKERVDQETAKGRVKGIDFDVDVRMKHPDGKQVQLDYVDLKRGIIEDRKPIKENESTKKVVNKYKDQRKRHIEAFEANKRTKILEYDYNLSKSAADLNTNRKNNVEKKHGGSSGEKDSK